MFFKKNIIIIVDAYGTGQYIAPGFISRGFDCIHIRSSDKIPPRYGNNYRKEDFIFEITFKEFKESPDILSQYSPLLVIPGAESGVEMAEVVAKILDTPHQNKPGTAERCRNKFVMQESLSAAGIAHLKQTLTYSAEEAIQWKHDSQLTTLVLKPVDSSGSEDVYICHSDEEIRIAHQKIMGSQTKMETLNTSVLTQEYLLDSHNEGNDTIAYNANSVSLNGQHYVTEIIRVYKRIVNGVFIHNRMELLCPIEDQSIFEKIESYSISVLKAIGFQAGFSHSEIIIDKGIPKLIEIAGRCPGGSDPSAYTRCLESTQIATLISALFYYDNYNKLIFSERKKNLRHCLCVFLISNTTGKIKSDKHIAFWEKHLTSLHSIMIRDSDQLSITHCLTSSPGHIYLVSDNKKFLFKDLETIRKIESQYYELISEKD
ncbi:ATP-grasp domain-containing protein [Marinomonas spartinae]|uniref:ATP-grasp domain-containing protein n=1 Tax=Marinomonas spartinae TaxID=1792290 RepID=UPI0018F25041|nr:ATP-grasp domain-containing protein [Marinomonas spartinae]MBJ7553535.1 ATP-grasp domain-containing protein [Marinomonas spartinae]